MFREASKIKLRFTTTIGVVSVEDLWDMPLEALDSLAVELETKVKDSKKNKSFLQKKTIKDKTMKLRFDIVLEVLNYKVEERDAKLNENSKKQEKSVLMSILAKKKDAQLEELTVDEIEKRIKDI